MAKMCHLGTLRGTKGALAPSVPHWHHRMSLKVFTGRREVSVTTHASSAASVSRFVLHEAVKLVAVRLKFASPMFV